MQARQDRLNLSRKTKVDISSSSTKEGKDCALVRETASRQIGIAERSSLTAMSNDSKLEVPSRDTDLKLSEGGDIENSVSKEYGSTSDSGFKNGNSEITISTCNSYRIDLIGYIFLYLGPINFQVICREMIFE